MPARNAGSSPLMNSRPTSTITVPPSPSAKVLLVMPPAPLMASSSAVMVTVPASPVEPGPAWVVISVLPGGSPSSSSRPALTVMVPASPAARVPVPIWPPLRSSRSSASTVTAPASPVGRSTCPSSVKAIKASLEMRVGTDVPLPSMSSRPASILTSPPLPPIVSLPIRPPPRNSIVIRLDRDHAGVTAGTRIGVA